MKYSSPMARKPKKNHPWATWKPGWLKRPATPGYGYQDMKGITKPNRAK